MSIPEKHILAVVIKTKNEKYYQIDDSRLCSEGEQLNRGVGDLKRQAILTGLDTRLMTYIASCPRHEGPLIWEGKLSSKATKHFKFNPNV